MKSGPASFAPLFEFGNLLRGKMPVITDLNDAPFGWSRYESTAANVPSGISGFCYTCSSDGKRAPSATNVVRQSSWNDGWSYQSNQEATRLNPGGTGWTGWNQPALRAGSDTVEFSVKLASAASSALPLQQLLGRQKIITASGQFVPTYTGLYYCEGTGAGGGGGGSAGNSAGSVSGYGHGGGAGSVNRAQLWLTAGDVYTIAIGLGGTGGTAGTATPTVGGPGNGGGNTAISDPASTVLLLAGGGDAGQGSAWTGGGSVEGGLHGLPGQGMGNGRGGSAPATGSAGEIGYPGRSAGAGGGGASGNNAPAAAAAGSAGGAGYRGEMLLLW